MRSLGKTYELQEDWSNARQTYEKLLRHEPGNAGLQTKLKELGKKP
jgi:hypothetical protein